MLSACKTHALIEAAEPGRVQTILKVAETLFTKKVVHTVVKKSFFDHFCAGEDAKEIAPVLGRLRMQGVRGILDYAAEAKQEDVQGEDNTPIGTGTNARARTYSYDSEAVCHQNLEIFLKSIETVKDVTPQGFAAIKVTALGHPDLLETISSAIRKVQAKSFFNELSQDSSVITKNSLVEKLGAINYEDENHFFPQGGNQNLDYRDWITKIDLARLMRILPNALEPSEMALLGALRSRLRKLADKARTLKVGIMIDAEHSFFQPAIDFLTLDLQREFNVVAPYVLNTYQCYLKDSQFRLRVDIERSKQGNFHFGAKLVRGAYMHLERERAQRLHYSSPIHDNYEDTNRNYHECLDVVLHKISQDLQKHNAKSITSLMVASHNRQSIEYAIKRSDELGIPPETDVTGGVHFAQLLGMADNLTFTLGHEGYMAFKYVPYGPLEEVMPYLIRRAQENGDVLSKVDEERALIWNELSRRFQNQFSLHG